MDIEFPSDAMPEIYSALKVEITLADETTTITLEVAQHIGDGMVRAISMKPTDGLVRGATVTDTGGPISVPVGDITQGHVFNATGDVLNLEEGEKLRGHRALGHPPQGARRSTSSSRRPRCSRPASRSSTC